MKGMTSLTSTSDMPKPYGHTPNNKMMSENRNLAMNELEFYKGKLDKDNNNLQN
jgi:hypothetical protein